MPDQPEDEDPELRRQRIGHYWLATIRAQLTGKTPTDQPKPDQEEDPF